MAYRRWALVYTPLLRNDFLSIQRLHHCCRKGSHKVSQIVIDTFIEPLANYAVWSLRMAELLQSHVLGAWRLLTVQAARAWRARMDAMQAELVTFTEDGAAIMHDENLDMGRGSSTRCGAYESTIHIANVSIDNRIDNSSTTIVNRQSPVDN